MLNLPRWQVIGIIAVTALAALFALPNLLPAPVLDALPGWYSQNRINLGLDLRGGAHFLLEADLRSVMNERLTNLSDSVRGELRKNQVGVKEINVQNGASVVVVLRDEAQRAKALEAIRAVDSSPLGIGQRRHDPDRLCRAGSVPQEEGSDRPVDRDPAPSRRRDRHLEPTIVRQGDDRILLQVPGIKDTTELKSKINQTAKLTFHLVNEDVSLAGGLPATLPPTTTLIPTREGCRRCAPPIQRPTTRSWRPIPG